MSLTIPKDVLARIHLELASLPAIIGKVNLHLEFNCGSGRVIGSVKIKKWTEEEIRP